ncbi:MAG: PTS glucose transporter subunit IIA [Bacilli bacterium]|nr:PTS glucose transporter subunit IIA [Bacilli bacterium]
MGLFFKKKNKENLLIIYSPFDGKVVPIESLKDKTFASKVMGDGIAVIPSKGKIYAPISGTISALLDTKHAYGITSESGFDLLVHIGQDTVNLKGEGFTTNFKQDDKVNQGDLLGTFDIPFIEQHGYSIATPIILITGSEYKIKEKAKEGEIKVGDVLLTLSK